MKKLLITIGLTLAFASLHSAQQRVAPDRPNLRGAPKRGPTPTMLQLIEGMYVNALRQQSRQVELTDEQINKILPFLRQYVQDRNEIGGARRLRSQNQLQQALNRGASDDELVRLIQQFDRIEVDVRAAQEQFFANADPLLTIRQRAWLRVWQLRMEERIRRLIQEGAPPGAPLGPPPTPPRP